MDFGQFLFLYFVARNTSYFVSETIMWDVKKAYFGDTTKTPRSSRDEESFTIPADELPPYSQGKAPGYNKNQHTERPKDLETKSQILEEPSAPFDPDLAQSSSSMKMRRITSPSSIPSRTSGLSPGKGRIPPAYKRKR